MIPLRYSCLNGIPVKKWLCICKSGYEIKTQSLLTATDVKLILALPGKVFWQGNPHQEFLPEAMQKQPYKQAKRYQKQFWVYYLFRFS
jgi:hypothetical protein